jgi:hypothetical protein
MSKIGTATDKIGALSIMVIKDPIFRLEQLESLINMCTSNSSRIFELAIETCKDLFLNYLLPKRKLNSFKDIDYEFMNKLYTENKNLKNEQILLFIYFESNFKAL